MTANSCEVCRWTQRLTTEKGPFPMISCTCRGRKLSVNRFDEDDDALLVAIRAFVAEDEVLMVGKQGRQKESRGFGKHCSALKNWLSTRDQGPLWKSLYQGLQSSVSWVKKKMVRRRREREVKALGLLALFQSNIRSNRFVGASVM